MEEVWGGRLVSIELVLRANSDKEFADWGNKFQFSGAQAKPFT